MSCFLALLSTPFPLQLMCATVQLNVGLSPIALKLLEDDSFYSLVFLCLNAPLQKEGFKPQSLKRKSSTCFAVETCLLRRRTKTQKYKGVISEQCESGLA